MEEGLPPPVPPSLMRAAQETSDGVTGSISSIIISGGGGGISSSSVGDSLSSLSSRWSSDDSSHCHLLSGLNYTHHDPLVVKTTMMKQAPVQPVRRSSETTAITTVLDELSLTWQDDDDDDDDEDEGDHDDDGSEEASSPRHSQSEDASASRQQRHRDDEQALHSTGSESAFLARRADGNDGVGKKSLLAQHNGGRGGHQDAGDTTAADPDADADDDERSVFSDTTIDEGSGCDHDNGDGDNSETGGIVGPSRVTGNDEEDNDRRPPGGPASSLRLVRFADEEGLPIENVRHYNGGCRPRSSAPPESTST